MEEKEEIKVVFIQVFESKKAPLGVRAGSTVFESHAEADLQASFLTGILKNTYVGVGKVRFRVKV